METKNRIFEEEVVDTADLEGPFDPNAIDVDISVVNLGYLIEQLTYDEIDLTPEFQRTSDVWSREEKSRLIESVLLGLPLPSFYFSDDAVTGKKMIIDGLQRLCAFKDFWITKSLKLQGMQFLKRLEGKTVDDLDRSDIRRFQGLKVTLNTLRKGTPVKVKYIIFQRVNTAGKPLTPQEIRNALYQKTATDLLRRMAESESFKRATNHKVSTLRMADRDIANRFLAFYLNVTPYEGKLDAYMGDALEYVNTKATERVEEIYQTFCRTMDACHELFGERAFRRPNTKPNTKSKESYLPTNKSLFDALSVNLARMSETDLRTLLQRKDRFAEGMNALFADTQFVSAISEGTAKVSQQKIRFEKIEKLINQVMSYD
jgi:hypothetical protein